MRELDCPAGCTLLQAETDDLLTRALLEHVRTRHPQLGLDERRARRLVAANADDAPGRNPLRGPGAAC